MKFLMAAVALIAFVVIVACCICFCASGKRKGHTKNNAPGSQVPSDAEKRKNKKNTGYTNGLHSNLTIQTTMGSHENVVPEKVTPSSGNSSNLNNMKYLSNGQLNNPYVGYTEVLPDPVQYTQVSVTNTINPYSHVPADFLISHYDKVKQARSRGLPPPVMNAEEVAKNQDGSCFTGSDNNTSDRPSRDSDDSYDDNTIAVNPAMNHSPSHLHQHFTQHQYQPSNNIDWSYENVGYHAAQPAFVHYSQPVSYQEPAFYSQMQAPVPTHGIHDPSVLNSSTATSHHVIWQEGTSHPYLPRSATPTSDNSSNNHYPSDPRYGQRRSTTVSQV